MSELLTGAQILLECWKREKVEVVFGYPGAATVDIHHYLLESGLRFVLTRHEQAAVHAAEGYARATGRPGVVLVTSGPGATNTVTGLAGANMDSIPVLVFSGQVSRMMIGNDAFQEVDIVGVTRPVTKHNYLVRDTETLARTVKEAFHVARSGRPGSVLVDLPKDVLAGRAAFSYPEEVNLRAYQPHLDAHPRQVAKALELLKNAERPLLCAGGGVILAEAADLLRRLAETLEIPVVNTLMGLGGFPGDHPLFLGLLGMHGLYAANMAVQNADLIVAVGVRFDDRVTGRLDAFAPKARIVQIDIDPTSIHKRVKADVPLVADAGRALSALLEALGPPPAGGRAARRAWLDRLGEWQALGEPRRRPAGDEAIQPRFLLETLYQKTGGEAIITTEVGQHQMWAAQFYRYKRPRHFISSGGLGVMGFGLPAAVGAQVAHPGALVLDIAGDGSILMNIQELVTVVEEKLPVKVLVLNNGCLGMVRQWQQLFHDRRYAATLLGPGPDFARLAEAFGVRGLRARTAAEAEAALDEGLAHPGPVLMDFQTPLEELVHPMVPAGRALDEMLLRPADNPA